MSPAATPIGTGAAPTRSEIESWPTQHLEDAAGRWRKAATSSTDAFEQHHRNVDSPAGTTWEGDAKDAALHRVTGDLAVARRQAAVKGEAADLAESGAGDIRAVKARVLEAITDAEQDGFRVGEDLSVKDTRPVDLTNPQARYAAASTHAEFIAFRAAQLVQTDALIGQQLHAKAAELEGIRFDGEGENHDTAGGHGGSVQLVDNHFKLDPPPPGLPQPPGGWSDDPVLRAAQHIAYGHAWPDHLSDWNGMTQDELAALIRDMFTGDPRTDPTLHVGRIPGRSSTALFKDGIVVIQDPLTGDGGTAYRPVKGFDEFLRLVGGAGAAAPIISAPPNLPPTVPHPVENPLPAPAPHAPVAIPPLPADPAGLPPWLANPSPPPMPATPVGPLVLPNLSPEASAPAAAAGGLSLAALLALLLLSPA